MLRHFLAGIQFALGDLEADASPDAAPGASPESEPIRTGSKPWEAVGGGD
jgi:hypothetical protein